MNLIKSNAYRLVMVAAVCFTLGACGGDEGDSLPQVPANPDALCIITPHAIEISQVDASTTPITRSATGEPEQKATYAENLGVNYSAEATLEAVPQEEQTRATENLAAGAQYRIVVYDSAGEIKGNVVYKQGSSDVVSGETIKLKKGTYRLFTYTFNSTSTIRGLDADNKCVTVNNGEDFMTYTVDNYTVTSADFSSGKQLNINFVRQFVRLTVTIMADGYDNNTISAANVTVGNVFGSGSYKWNGHANTDASILPSTAGTASLTKATDNAVSVDCGPAADNPYLITAPCSNQTITISGLSVTIGGVVKTPAGFSFPYSVTLAKGGSYRLSITAHPYYVLSRHDYVTIGGVKWARTNLQQAGAGILATVTFTTNPWDCGSLWSWGMRDATVYGNSVYLSDNVDWNTYTSSGTNQNPCRARGSGWRLPIQGELNSLVNNPAPNGTKVKINGTINTIGTNGWASDAKGTVFISGNQVVLLPAAGYRYDGSMHDPGSIGYYWSDTPGSSEAAYCLLFVSGSNFAVPNAKRSTSMSLRCVQD